MLLTITYTGQDTTELGYLLYKNPNRPQVFELNYGKAYVFYPEVSDERTTVALLIDIDPLDLARGKVGSSGGGLFDYVNDRPYVSSSFMSTAISRVFGTAMSGRADSRQELSDTPLDLSATVTMLPCRTKGKLNAVFEPLGYKVSYETFVADEKFPLWGESKYANLTISGNVRLRDLLKHLFVLIPVFDRKKHYWVGKDEVDKLLRNSEDWLQAHPEKDYIMGQYLNRQRRLINLAYEKLDDETGELNECDDKDETPAKKRLNEQRLECVVAVLKDIGAKRIIDMGCGEGRLLNLLVKERQFTDITGVDVSQITLERAKVRLKLDKAGDSVRERVRLIQGSLTYRDARFFGYDAACVVEVIEHLDVSRIAAFERVLFEFAKPSVVVLTTPNKEYNAHYSGMDGEFRHADHRFEWTRAEFREWAEGVAARFGYAVEFSEIGEIDEVYGSPTQMGVFKII